MKNTGWKAWNTVKRDMIYYRKESALILKRESGICPLKLLKLKSLRKHQKKRKNT